MALLADDFAAENAEIIWVLEQSAFFQPGTAQRCMDTMDDLGNPSVGWCVGDSETQPVAGSFDDSPFSNDRGFDMIVPTSTMRIEYTTSHGTGGQDENPSGQDVLDALRDVLAAQ